MFAVLYPLNARYIDSGVLLVLGLYLLMNVAFLHVLSDTVSSVAILVGAGAMVVWGGVGWVDPILSLAIACLILWGATRLILEEWESMPVWKVRLWAAKLQKSEEMAEVGDVFIDVQDGKVLIVGGQIPSGCLSSAELFDETK